MTAISDSISRPGAPTDRPPAAAKRPAAARGGALAKLRRELADAGSPADAAFLQRFFRTGPGEYGAGDRFRGIRVPALRQLVRLHADLPEIDVLRLLASRYHEDRLMALLLLVHRFERGDATVRRAIYDAYLAHADRVNNWDLVDLSAPGIVGAWLLQTNDPAPLGVLAASGSLWQRRIAMVATYAFIRAGQTKVAVDVADRLRHDPHDLIHKATGWMLREVGKRDPAALVGYLERRAGALPRTALRYALERQPPAVRQHFMTVERERS